MSTDKKQALELLKKTREDINALSAAHHALATSDNATVKAVRETGDAVKAARQKLVAVITEGANPCPTCGAAPTGIEHQVKFGFEYEVGCLACPPIQDDDGTERRHSARGGTMPHHAVEAWNAGPDFWSPKARPEGTEVKPKPEEHPEDTTILKPEGDAP